MEADYTQPESGRGRWIVDDMIPAEDNAGLARRNRKDIRSS